ncbi:MAG: hypothetical protein V2A58_14470 [Planctomycetota bacterium]
MRCSILVLTAFLVLLGPYIVAQEEEDYRRGMDTSDLQREHVEVAGGENLWSYLTFLVIGLGTVYFVFRGNKRA